MEKLEILDKLFDIQEQIATGKYTISDVRFSYLVFVRPGEKIENALHIAFPIIPGDADCVEKHLKFFRRRRKDIPEGNIAVFVCNPIEHSYVFFKNIKHRRKSFALSCDSE